MQSNVINFRRPAAQVPTRKPRASKNGTPDARAYGAQLKADIDAGTNPVILAAQLREFENLIRGMQPRLYPKALGVLRRVAEG